MQAEGGAATGGDKRARSSAAPRVTATIRISWPGSSLSIKADAAWRRWAVAADSTRRTDEGIPHPSELITE